VKKRNDFYRPNKQIHLVQKIFSSITHHYDFLNHLLSFGQDIIWRKKAVHKMRFFSTMKCLDIATGTGDIAFAIAKKFPSVSVTGLDFSPAMIQKAIQKRQEQYPSSNIQFITGDATNLPFPNDQFDTTIIAFGIRNIPDKKKVLSEMTRVVVPNGIVLVLEMVSQQNQWIQRVYQWYLCSLLPSIAALFSQNKTAYRYLGESILHFPTTEEFYLLMENAGLQKIRSIPFTMGITRLFIGTKKV
jgi:demethylmenaquinone methyltransferase / 2-methoxy-6-polyprenyl-1,4-benzoquinol methylase